MPEHGDDFIDTSVTVDWGRQAYSHNKAVETSAEKLT